MVMGLERLRECVDIIVAIKSGGWWTPAELASKTGNEIGDVDAAIKDLRERNFLERRHLGSDERGDLFAYRMREGA